ncbi:MAG: hypothetical protein JWO56_2607 [Acidobacteria bacterium]|nr:hypothetical protein [Acidobacteriota bacterium]
MWTTDDVDRAVAELDETRRTEYFRSPDRPNSSFFPRRSRRDPEIVRAQARLRTQHWRMRMDQRQAPTAAQIGGALVHALINTPGRLADLTAGERDLIGRMLVDLRDRGFSVVEALRTLKRLQERQLEAAERDRAPESMRRAG